MLTYGPADQHLQHIPDGNGDGTFTAVEQIATGTLCLSVVAADFDGNGLPDLAVASASNDTIETFRNVGGYFVTSTAIKTPSDPFALVAADFTDDGRIDLAVTSYGVGGSRSSSATATARSMLRPRYPWDPRQQASPRPTLRVTDVSI